MSRLIPDCPQKPTLAVDAGRSYDIKLITPLFGGGVEPRVNDPRLPIRPTAIRGQLQFWWRATVGAKFATSPELRAAQSEIWGSTKRASRVEVMVDNVRRDDPSPCARIEWNQHSRSGRGGWQTYWQDPFDGRGSALPYALFPFQGVPPADSNATITVPPAACIRNASFQLRLRCPKDLWPQVEPAVWAWANFGGLGSRTRRGCGAIQCKELAPQNAAEFTAKLKEVGSKELADREWPTVCACVLLGAASQDNPIAAWESVIESYRHFRQGEGMGRNHRDPKSNRPGRSRFPEPESIRRVMAAHSSRHGRLSHIPDDAFPRAEFGLPIVFHFQPGQGDPLDTFLYPSNDPQGKPRERMASPLILKPLALADGKAVPLILRLKTPALTGVDLRKKVKEKEISLPLPPSTVIRDPRMSRYKNSPLAGVRSGSALDAFLAIARAEGFTEVLK